MREGSDGWRFIKVAGLELLVCTGSEQANNQSHGLPLRAEQFVSLVWHCSVDTETKPIRPGFTGHVPWCHYIPS